MAKYSYTMQKWFEAAWERAKIPIRSDHPSEGEICTYQAVHDNVPGCFIGVVFTPEDAELADKIGGPWALMEKGLIEVIDLDELEVEDYFDSLQGIHDYSDPEDWARSLRAFAKKHKLVVPD